MESNKAFRMTEQKRSILEVLKAAMAHPTADEVYQTVRRRLPRISLGTVYRNLEILASRGIIRKLDFLGGQRRFDFNPEMHYHARCIQCGAVQDVALESPVSPERMLKDSAGYEVLGVKMEFVGICPACRSR